MLFKRASFTSPRLHQLLPPYWVLWSTSHKPLPQFSWHRISGHRSVSSGSHSWGWGGGSQNPAHWWRLRCAEGGNSPQLWHCSLPAWPARETPENMGTGPPTAQHSTALAPSVTLPNEAPVFQAGRLFVLRSTFLFTLVLDFQSND